MDAIKLEILKRAAKGDAVLTTYSTAFTLNAPMIAKRLEINNRVTLIKGYDVIAKTVLEGLTTMKDLNCLIMGGKGIILVSQMIEYFKATATADPIKLGQISFTLTDLTSGAAGDIYDRNMVVSNVFHACVADMVLKFYPVTPLMDTGYSTAINSYNTAVPGWGNGEVIREAANVQIGLECQKLTNLNFPSIKNFVFGYKEANAMFYTQIVIAYKSMGVTARKKSIELHVEELVTGTDVVGYKGILVASDGTQHIGIGGKKGSITYNSLPTDVYNLVLTRVGYLDKTITGIGYTAGKIMTINTKMALGENPEMVEILAKSKTKIVSTDSDTEITEVDETTGEGSETPTADIPPPTI